MFGSTWFRPVPKFEEAVKHLVGLKCIARYTWRERERERAKQLSRLGIVHPNTVGGAAVLRIMARTTKIRTKTRDGKTLLQMVSS